MAQHYGGLRGGAGGGAQASALPDVFDAAAIGAHADRQPSATSSSPRRIRFSPPAHLEDSSGSNSAVQSLTSSSTLESKLDLTPDDAAARKSMLKTAIFPALKNDAGHANLENIEEMQQNDPLGTQIWKLYAKARTQLPNAERMENLTWRMMTMNMRRAELDRNKGYGRRHVTAAPSTCDSRKPLLTFTRTCRSSASSDMKPPPTIPASASAAPRSAPSGIAQLRKSVDQQAQTPQADAMNLDEFIFPSSVGSPAGLPPSPSNEMKGASNATAPAIPIRKPNQSSDHNLSLARASAPSVPPTITRENEFGYVQRHVRKTSIDERRVSRYFRRPSYLVP